MSGTPKSGRPDDNIDARTCRGDAFAPDAAWLTVCAWCDRVRIRDRWLDPERAGVPTHGLNLTHGICPACLNVALRHHRSDAA
jgi:hypothetical protein